MKGIDTKIDTSAILGPRFSLHEGTCLSSGIMQDTIPQNSLMLCKEKLSKFVLFKMSSFSQDLATWLEVLLGFLERRRNTDLEKTAVMSAA